MWIHIPEELHDLSGLKNPQNIKNYVTRQVGQNVFFKESQERIVFRVDN